MQIFSLQMRKRSAEITIPESLSSECCLEVTEYKKEIDRKMKVKVQNKRQKGMTLIEITLVIAILLGLIAILFLGVTAYKKGGDRAKCILQLSMLEKLAISHGNMSEVSPQVCS